MLVGSDVILQLLVKSTIRDEIYALGAHMLVKGKPFPFHRLFFIQKEEIGVIGFYGKGILTVVIASCTPMCFKTSHHTSELFRQWSEPISPLQKTSLKALTADRGLILSLTERSYKSDAYLAFCFNK